MPSDLITSVGLGGTLSLLIIREVFGFLKGRKLSIDGPKVCPAAAAIEDSICKLDEKAIAKIHNIHDVLTAVDEDGAPRVFTPRSHLRLLEMIAQTQKQQEAILDRLVVCVERR